MVDRHNHGAKKEPSSFLNEPDLPRRDQRFPEVTGEYVGLCATCELRESCDKPKAPGGIWSCNDYSEL